MLRKKFDHFFIILFEFTLLILLSLSGLFFLYVVLAFLMSFLIPELHIPLNETLFALSNKQLSIYLGSAFLIIVTCLFIRLSQKRMKGTFFYRLPKDEIFIYVITSIFFGHFFAYSLTIFSTTFPILFVIFTGFFLIIMPSIVDLYKNWGFINIRENLLLVVAKDEIIHLKFKNSVPLFKWSSIRNIVFYIVILLISLLMISLIISVVIIYSYNYAVWQRQLKESISIVNVNSKITTLGEKVKLKGYNFGWRERKRDGLMSNYGGINDLKLWVDNEIDFIVPLHWPEGTVRLWVEKEKRDELNKIQKSNIVELTIVSRWSFYPAREDYESDKFYLSRIIKKLKRFYYLHKSIFN